MKEKRVAVDSFREFLVRITLGEFYGRTKAQEAECRTIVNTIFKTIAEALHRGETVTIAHLGTFRVHTIPQTLRHKRYSWNGNPNQSSTVLELTKPQKRVVFTPAAPIMEALKDKPC